MYANSFFRKRDLAKSAIVFAMKVLVHDDQNFYLKSEEILSTTGRVEDAACLDMQASPNTAEEAKRRASLCKNFDRHVLEHNYQDIIDLFNSCFLEAYNTRLVKGDDEPLYLPADETRPHSELFFAHGFFASALHETAHWLIAGSERRKLVDFGYWYEPDGRTREQQTLFQSVEVKPQAMEWILSQAAQFRFRVSIDNLNGQESDTTSFKHAVHKQVQAYCEKGLPQRANTLRQALCSFYDSDPTLRFEDFLLDNI